MSHYLRVKAIVEVLQKKFPDLNDERGVYIAYEILDVLNRLGEPVKIEAIPQADGE